MWQNINCVVKFFSILFFFSLRVPVISSSPLLLGFSLIGIILSLFVFINVTSSGWYSLILGTAYLGGLIVVFIYVSSTIPNNPEKGGGLSTPFPLLFLLPLGWRRGLILLFSPAELISSSSLRLGFFSPIEWINFILGLFILLVIFFLLRKII